MNVPLARLGLALAAAMAASTSLSAQGLGEPARPQQDPRLLLRYATFDPLVGLPEIPPSLRAGADTQLWIVQFATTPTDADRDAVRAAGGTIVGYLPHDSHVVRAPGAAPKAIAALGTVRWVGAYEPAYRLEAALLREHLAGRAMPVRRYNLVMADKRRDKQALEARIVAIGGEVVDRHPGGLLFTAALTGPQLLQAARFDEVLWIDRWSAPERDMDNVRIQGGANALEAAAGYTGLGIRGHVYEGVQANHPDFTVLMTPVRCNGAPDAHGHCTAGIVFGNGTSAAQARGLAPEGIGFYTNYDTVTAGFSRNMVIDDVVNVHECLFTTASWGAATTTAYTSDSADADDIVFDHRIPWTQSMSNTGNQNARPQAWAKNVISVGGVRHFNNSDPTDDSWLAGNASIGPAADGRSKPDLCAFFDSVWTSDLQVGVSNAVGSAATGGFDPLNDSFTGFSGTSAATPIVAGFNALAIEMYTDHLFNNPPRVVGGSRFQNRPYAQTLKALMIVGADQYTATATDNRREHVGWGFPNVDNLYTRRDRFTIVPEDAPIEQGQVHTYQVEVLAGETDLKVCMTYLDPAGIVAAAIDRVNDLTLRVFSPTGVGYWGNVALVGAAQGASSLPGGSPDTLDTVECVFVASPTPGTWTIEISAPVVAQDAELSTPATDASYALVVNGGAEVLGSGCARYVPDASPAGPGNYYPWGGYAPDTLATTFTSNNGGNPGGAVFFDLTVQDTLYLTSLDVNTDEAVGTALLGDVYVTAIGGTYAGNEGNLAAWIPKSALSGVAAGQNNPSRLDLATPFRLDPGTYGVAILAGNFRHRYTNGTGLNQSYANADVSLSLGSAANVFGGTVFSPRVANVEIGYRRELDNGTNMRYQTILRQTELATAGDITGLAFSAQALGRHWNDSLRVRMSHVPAGHTLTTSFASNLPTPVTVLDVDNHSFEFTANTWHEIGLQAPFAYDGVSDVVVDIVARGNWQTTPGLFNRGSEPRVVKTSWAGAPPQIGTVDDLAARMRVSFACADANQFGASCGKLWAGHIGNGARGVPFQFTCGAADPNSLVFLSLGLDNPAPFPISMTPLGWRNCHVWHSSDAILAVPTNAGGYGGYVLNVPNSSAFDGFKVYGTWLGLDATEPGNVTLSGYTRMIVGVQP